jgi:pyrroloquinoline quinone (PQQ) biosynthesis protein C
MDKLVELRSAWEDALPGFLRGEFFRRLQAGTLNLEHYKALLREVYYNTRENPPTFAMMVAHLRGRKRDLAAKIYRHCLAETGHHEMALEDLAAVGGETAGIPGGLPLPTTEALIAFPVYQIQHGNPIGYLGYVYHLEMLPALQGGSLLAKLSEMGVPEAAMGFLAEHAKLDPAHVRWLEDYITQAAETREDLDAIIRCMRGTSALHGLMLQGILDSVPERRDWIPMGPEVSVAAAKIPAKPVN